MADREYLVEWSAADPHKAGTQSVMARNKPAAVRKVRARLGKRRIKREWFHNFEALGPFKH